MLIMELSISGKSKAEDLNKWVDKRYAGVLGTKEDTVRRQSSRAHATDELSIMYALSLEDFLTKGAGKSQVVFINDEDKSGIFRYDPKDNITKADTAMVLIFNGKRYKRFTDYVAPEMFGAKRDGKTDDYTAIQKMFNYAAKNKATKIVFAAGTYMVGTTLKLKPINGAPHFNYNLMLSGAGIGGTEIKGTNTIKGNLLEMNYGQTKFEGRDSRVVIRDISFTAGNAEKCFYADFVSQLRLEDCRFNGGQEYTAQIGSEDPTLNYSTYITRCYFGGWTTSGGLNKATLVVKHSLFIAIDQMETDGGRIGIDLSNSAACIINNSKIEGCKYAGIRMTGTVNGEHRITNNYISCYGGWDFNAQYDGKMHGILVQGSNAGSSATNTIANNIIRVEAVKDMNSVVKVSSSSKIQYNPTGNLVTGKISGATGHVWGVNEDNKSLAIKPVSGKFQKGETIEQAKTGGKAVLSEIVTGISYGIKLEGSNGSNNISGNQLTTQPTYGIHINSGSNMIIGNSIGGATCVYSNADNTSLISNMFWSVTAPRVAVHKEGGQNFTSFNNNFSGGALIGLNSENNVTKSLQTTDQHIMITDNQYLSKINRSGKDVFALSNKDSTNVSMVGLNGSTLWLGNSKTNDVNAQILGITPNKVILMKDIPSSPAGLPSGALWIDKPAGNVLKIVP